MDRSWLSLPQVSRALVKPQEVRLPVAGVPEHRTHQENSAPGIPSGLFPPGRGPRVPPQCSRASRLGSVGPSHGAGPAAGPPGSSRLRGPCCSSGQPLPRGAPLLPLPGVGGGLPRPPCDGSALQFVQHPACQADGGPPAPCVWTANPRSENSVHEFLVTSCRSGSEGHARLWVVCSLSLL